MAKHRLALWRALVSDAERRLRAAALRRAQARPTVERAAAALAALERERTLLLAPPLESVARLAAELRLRAVEALICREDAALECAAGEAVEARAAHAVVHRHHAALARRLDELERALRRGRLRREERRRLELGPGTVPGLCEGPNLR